MTQKRDEIWTMRDGTKIAVGDMDEQHVRNALRMVLRKWRLRQERRAAVEFDMTIGESQDLLAAEAYRMLANPHAYFPLLDGGTYGSPELQKRYGGRI